MSEEVYNQDNSNLDGTVDNGDYFTGRLSNKTVQLVNDTDVSIDYTLQGTRAEDTNFTDAHGLDTVTVASGANDVITLHTDTWELLRISIDPDSDPTSGSAQAYLMEET